MSELKDKVVNTLAWLIAVMVIVIPIACGSCLFMYLTPVISVVISAVLSLITAVAIFVLEVLAIIALM